MNIEAIERLWHRVRMIVGRSRITSVDDSGVIQRVQVRLTAYELMDGAMRVAEYGFQSNPPVGTDAVSVHLSGERSLAVVIGTNNQTFRMRGLASGEVAISDDKGRFVLLGAVGIQVQGKDDPVQVETTSTLTAIAGSDIDVTSTGGSVSVTAATTLRLMATSIQLEASSVRIQGDTLAVSAATAMTGAVSIAGDTSIEGALTNNGENVGNAHEHGPGTFKAGTTAVTGVSGGVTP